MRTALYIRVSTREQLDGYSISAQKRQLTAYCESQGWDVVGYYVEEGESAKDTKRTELQRMLGHIKEDKIDCVLVYKLDRLTRSVADLYELLKVFDKHKCKFKSATEVYDTTSAMGRMFITLVASFAQFEQERLSERVSMGMEQLTHEGKWKGGHVGYGHDWKNEQFVIVEHEAEVIRDMYKWYLEGLSFRRIAIKLNDLGITTRSGAKWTERKVVVVMNNKKNIGTLQYGVRVNQDKSFMVENTYPPIIDKDTFDKVQTLKIRRNNQHGKQATSSYYYSGILTCSRCGTTFKGIKTRGFKRYVCRSKTMHECDMPSMSESLIDIKFVQALKDYAEEPENLMDSGKKEDNKKETNIRAELDKIRDRRKKWQYAWANEMIDDDEFQNRMKEEQDKETYYNDKLKDFQESGNQEIDKDVLDMLKNASDNWKYLSELEKKQLIQIAVDKIIIEIHPDKPKSERLEVKEVIFS